MEESFGNIQVALEVRSDRAGARRTELGRISCSMGGWLQSVKNVAFFPRFDSVYQATACGIGLVEYSRSNQYSDQNGSVGNILGVDFTIGGTPIEKKLVEYE